MSTKQPITMLNDRLLVQIPQNEGERASRALTRAAMAAAKVAGSAE